jgi:hypothetical protein
MAAIEGMWETVRAANKSQFRQKRKKRSLFPSLGNETIGN